MSQPPNDPPAPGDRTQFVPQTSETEAGQDGAAPLDAWLAGAPAPADQTTSAKAPDPTIFQPAPWERDADAAAEPARAPPVPSIVADPQESGGQIAVGARLNNIYVVRRLLARGGMGEVYEGVNSLTEERVAIKVILPHLANNPSVQAMFRKEARTLTELSHSALVQYRVLAEEPALGVLYIVTEFIDGVSLADQFGLATPTEGELIALTRRLAEGLRVAHGLQKIHRDLSPDNILLPGGRLSEAKIIDFGIAKDLQASTGTVVGDGFAGKLSYVAPEQFGDYGREIGPWTDVYSLGLVLLGLQAGRSVDMGATLVDAIEKRRKGVDLSALPERLRPLFGRMLAPDPAHRFRSMDEVLDALTSIDHWKPVDEHRRTPWTRGRLIALAGGGAALLVLALVGARLATPHHPTPALAVPASNTLALRASDAIDAALPALPCSWVQADRVSETDGRVSVKLSGASNDPAGAAGKIDAVLKGQAATTTDIDSLDVATLRPQACAAIDAFRALRAASSNGVPWITTTSREFHFERHAECSDSPNKALAVIETVKPGPGEDIAVIGMEDTGRLQTVFTSLHEFRAFATQLAQDQALKNMFVEEDGKLRLNICTDTAGVTGLILIRGRPPFDLKLPSIAEEPKVPSGDFPKRLEAAARAGGWKTQMAWYRVVAR